MADTPQSRRDRLERILDKGVRATQHDGERIEFQTGDQMQARLDRMDAEAELAVTGRKKFKRAFVMRGGAGYR